MVCCIRRRLVAFVIIFLLVASESIHAADASARRVLILNEVGTTYPAINLVDQGIRESLSEYSEPVEYYREYMDLLLFPDHADQQRFREFYIQRYRHRIPDVIVTVGSSPLAFITDIHDTVFPGVPVVFCLSNSLERRTRLGASFTGVSAGIESEATLRAALSLLPSTRNVVVVAGSAPYDKERLAAIESELGGHKDGVEVSYITDFTMPALLEKLKRLPNRTIVLLGSIGKDGAGTTFTSADTGRLVSGASRVPVFSVVDLYIGHGEIGGYVSSIITQGRVAGQIAADIFKGTRPQDIPIATAPNSYIFDWRALEKWRLKSSNLPVSSVLLNRPVSAWESYKRYIIFALAVALAQAVFIVALLIQRRKRRLAEAQVRESEERFRRVANSAPVLIWMSGQHSFREYFNEPWLEFTGRSSDEEAGDGWLKGVHSVDLGNCLNTYEGAFHERKPFTMEYRLRRNDGEYRWVVDCGVPRMNPDGSFGGYIGSCIDVTERKLAEEALAQVGQRLIEAQEQERARVAQELHDDIVQRLALLQITLDRLVVTLPGSRAAIRAELDEFSKEIFEVSKDVQAISHRLHSSKLEYLGMVRAMEDFCEEVSGQYAIQVRFSASNVPRSIPDDIARCLFRILQAALTNAVKHSGTEDFVVEVTGTSGGVHLTVRDTGAGFDVERALSKGHGIGLISMRERVRLVNGRIVIASKPNVGTAVEVEVPVDHDGESSYVT